MRADMQFAPPPEGVFAGDVFRAHGPRHDGFWLVVAVNGNSAHCLGLSRDGEITSTASYGLHALREREVVGRCVNLNAINLEITWLGRLA